MEDRLDYLEYGCPEGKLVIYFHGASGSPEECSVFYKYAKEHGLRVICYDRFSICSSLKEQDYYKHLASIIRNKANGEKVIF